MLLLHPRSRSKPPTRGRTSVEKEVHNDAAKNEFLEDLGGYLF